MKILLVTPKISGIGGVAPHTLKLYQLLVRDGHQVKIMSIENVIHIPIKGLYNPTFAGSSFFKSLWAKLMGEKFDVVHAHNFPSWPAAEVSNSRLKVLTLHGIFSIQHRLLHGNFIGSLAGTVEKRWTSKADTITCISKKCLRYYVNFNKNTVYVPNAIDTDSLPEEGIRLADKQVVYIGRLSYEKGADILVKALDQIDSSIKVLIIGFGKDDLVKEAQKKHENLKYLGYLPHEQAMKYLKGSDALVIPSREEGLPTVLLEAMALKVPIIASDISEISDVTENIIKIKCCDEKALAQAVNSVALFDIRPNVARAYEEVKDYEWKSVYKKYIEVYEGKFR
ncbi:MAG: glycosyltransferase family 4 protein [Nitrososphaeria archaeon]